eukprot:2109060-Pyramimonas_sp.AAC.1
MPHKGLKKPQEGIKTNVRMAPRKSTMMPPEVRKKTQRGPRDASKFRNAREFKIQINATAITSNRNTTHLSSKQQ